MPRHAGPLELERLMVVSLHSQLSALDVVITSCIPMCGMKKAARDLLIDQITAVRMTIELLEAYEPEVRAAIVAAKKGSAT
jgi:hypothetical protein